MIHLLRSLLGSADRKTAAKKSGAGARTAGAASGEYRAVSLASSAACCSLANGSTGKRYLLREAPHIPLANCAHPDRCACKFRKHADRRDGDRRLLGEVEATRWFAGSEHRARRRRRPSSN